MKDPARLNAEEQKILGTLDELVRETSTLGKIHSLASEMEHELASKADQTVVARPLPREIYGNRLPDAVRSSWVFVLRAVTNSGAERHPDSHQRSLSLRGRGDFQLGQENGWRSNLLASDPRGNLERRWISIPPNVWHQAVVPEEDWMMVSFHSVPGEELQRETPDSSDPRLLSFPRPPILPNG